MSSMTIPDSDREALKRARLLAGTGRFDEARQVLDDLGESPAVRAEGLWLRGEIGLREGRFEAARGHLAAARRLAPDHPGILHALAGASHVLGDHARVLQRHLPAGKRREASSELPVHGVQRRHRHGSTFIVGLPVPMAAIEAKPKLATMLAFSLTTPMVALSSLFPRLPGLTSCDT